MFRLFKKLKPYRKMIAATLVLLFLQSFSQLFLPALMAKVVDTGIVNGDISYIVQVGSIMLFVAAMGVAFSIWGSYYTAKIASGFGRDVRHHIFSRTENFSLQEFDHFGTSSLITRTTNDVIQVQQVLTMMFRTLIMAPLLFIGALIIALWMNPGLSIVVVAPLPIIAAAILLIARKGIPLFKSLKEKTDRMNLILREGLTGIRVIRSFNRSGHEKKRFDAVNHDYSETAIKVNRLMVILTPLMMIVLNFSIIALVWLGALRIEAGSLQVGELMAFIQYAMQIMFAFIMASVMFVAIPRASVSAKRINEVIDSVPSMRETEHLVEMDGVKGGIEFKNVTFSYQESEKPVLTDISFKANPGELTAIIGGTGAGKSTLVSLLPRFYDILDGRILIDGTNIRDISKTELRRNIGYVTQQAHLFRGTLADNIRYGNSTATDEEVNHAADTAQAGFIYDLEGGFDATVAKGGANFSGGQRQRIAIARALVRNPAIYIFDDSFSAVDFKTAARLRTALQAETAGSTVFMVTQRIEVAQEADQIIVLDEGRIAGIGKHHELMKTCEIYREIVSAQYSEEGIS